MNLQAIKKNCLNTMRFQIFNTPGGGQWLGDGGSFWAVDGLRLSEDCIPALFDLTERQIANSTIAENDIATPLWTNRESYPGERELEEIGIIWHDKDLYLALGDTRADGTGALIMIPGRALKPLRKSEEYRRYYLRCQGETAAVAVYGDLFCDALICPMAPAGVDLIMSAASRASALPVWQPPRGGAKEAAEAAMAIMAEAMGVKEGE